LRTSVPLPLHVGPQSMCHVRLTEGHSAGRPSSPLTFLSHPSVCPLFEPQDLFSSALLSVLPPFMALDRPALSALKFLPRTRIRTPYPTFRHTSRSPGCFLNPEQNLWHILRLHTRHQSTHLSETVSFANPACPPRSKKNGLPNLPQTGAPVPPNFVPGKLRP
jgi:hypothetical protein